jgi:hypothetical protein
MKFMKNSRIKTNKKLIIEKFMKISRITNKILNLKYFKTLLSSTKLYRKENY